MRKFLFILALVAFATSAWAQQTPKKPSFAGFVSNGFWDNWEVSLGGGVGTAFSNGSNSGSFGDRLGFEANFSLTKWVHPVVGMRLQLQGGKFMNYDADLGKLKWPYIFVHTDFMINFSNWAGGYREDRAYYLVPFAGFGYLASNFGDKNHEANQDGTHQTFAFSYGLLNKFRLSRAFDFNIELKGILAPSRISPAQMDGSYLLGLSATAGFTYRFNQRDWQRGVPGYTAGDIQALQDAVAAGMAAAAVTEAENVSLIQQLAEAQADAAAAQAAAERAAAAAKVTVQPQKVDPSTLILYDYSMSKLTPKDKTRLQLVAERIKAGPKDKVYTIVGHADQQTGTAVGNKRVADNRAKNVYDYLISLGINSDQLTYEGKGDSPDIFNIQKANRAAIIK